jgi:hypothetical protein
MNTFAAPEKITMSAIVAMSKGEVSNPLYSGMDRHEITFNLALALFPAAKEGTKEEIMRVRIGLARQWLPPVKAEEWIKDFRRVWCEVTR